MLRTLRFIPLVIMAYALADCSAHANGGIGLELTDGGSTGNDTPVTMGGGAVSSFCTALCNREMAAGCAVDGGATSCVSLCAGVFGPYNAQCPGQFQTYAACVPTQSVSCLTATTQPPCETQLSALTACVLATSSLDAGVQGPDVIEPPIDNGPMNPGTPSCSSICGRVGSASGCTATDASNCASTCAEIESEGVLCTDQVNNFLTCSYTSPIQCTSAAITFTACSAEETSLLQCLGVDSGVVTQPDAGFPTDTGTDPCAGIGTCGTCIMGDTCGWCNGRCYNGTADGPTGATCTSGTWAWTACPDAG